MKIKDKLDSSTHYKPGDVVRFEFDDTYKYYIVSETIPTSNYFLTNLETGQIEPKTYFDSKSLDDFINDRDCRKIFNSEQVVR